MSSRRLGPSIKEVSEEFNLLALSFDNCLLPEYSALCYLGVAKCEKALGNTLTETEALLKSARCFVKADNKTNGLNIKSNNNEHLEGALRCYNQALSKFDDDSVMKAAVIREIKKINPNVESTSNFNSPSHRIYDLELSAGLNIKSGNFMSALEKHTEIYDDITERNVESYYNDVMQRNEITRLFLIILLQLPPSRHTPSHIKLLEKYSSNDITKKSTIPEELFLLLQGLFLACQSGDFNTLIILRNDIFKIMSITNEQKILLDALVAKYCS